MQPYYQAYFVMLTTLGFVPPPSFTADTVSLNLAPMLNTQHPPMPMLMPMPMLSPDAEPQQYKERTTGRRWEPQLILAPMLSRNSTASATSTSTTAAASLSIEAQQLLRWCHFSHDSVILKPRKAATLSRVKVRIQVRVRLPGLCHSECKGEFQPQPCHVPYIWP